MSVCHFDHGEADHFFAHQEALLKDLNNLVFALFLIVHMHHGVVERGVELLPQTFYPGGTQLFQGRVELVHDHLNPLAVGFVLCGLGERPDQIVIDRKELCHRVGPDVGVKAVPLLLAALAVVVVLGQQPEIPVVGALQFLRGVRLGLRFSLRLFGGFFLFLLRSLLFRLLSFGLGRLLYLSFLLSIRCLFIFVHRYHLP